MKVKAVGLISGGLDSILAVKVIQEQGIEVIGIAFETPFFGADKAREAAAMIGCPLLVVDITDDHLAMLKSPAYGYGKNMNPCIDCHIMMVKKAGEKMSELAADFIFTGEVLGQRPMSQGKQSLHIVAKRSGYDGYVLRPLSAKLLPETIPETEGKVKREELLDIQGRGRKRQMALADQYGIRDYSNPAGGCLLTDPMFAKRLRDLFNHQTFQRVVDFELLRYGRHLRLNARTKLIVGRNRADNQTLQRLAQAEDWVLKVRNFPGPTVIMPSGSDDGQLKEAAAVCILYSDAPKDIAVVVKCRKGFDSSEIAAVAAPKDEVRQFII